MMREAVWFWLMGWGLCSGLLLLMIPVLMGTKKYHIFDVVWGVGIALSGAVTVWIRVPSIPTVGIVAILAIVLWGLRLSGFLFITRILSGHRDTRYHALTATSRGVAILKQWVIQSFLQSIMVLTLLPIMYASHGWSKGAYYGLFLGGAVYLVGLLFESLADWQLHHHKQTRSGICQSGLWAYSRHPNYFFECVVWLGIAGMLVTLPMGWLALIGPVLIFCITYFVTGPFTERVSHQRRGEAFEAYQNTTSYFFPRRPIQ